MQEIWKIISDACSFIGDHLAAVLLAVTAIAGIIEKSKVAAKPISKFFTWINKMSNKEVLDKIEEVKKDVNNLQDKVIILDEKVDSNERDRIRNEILTFSSHLRDGKKYSKDAFKHIQDIYYKYHEELHGNGLVSEEYEYIMAVYNNTKF